MGTRQEELENELVDSNIPVLIVVGAGVSMASTEGNLLASWLGLLRDGVEYCAGHCSELPNRWVDRRREDLEHGDLVEILSVAEDISARLSYPNGGEYVRWLSETVGRLKATDSRVIKALSSWNAQIATTNYDDLIEQVISRKSITWKDRPLAVQFLRSELWDVLHLHGHWSKPDSVVLGIRSYDQILGDEHTQEILRAFLMSRTIVFVGCGAGLEDPNFGALLKWGQRILSGSVHRHYRLACRTEVDEFQRQHPAGSRIAIIEYGESHRELAGYLEGVAERVKQRRSPPVAPLHQLIMWQTDSERRHAELEARRTSLGLGAFLREKAAMAEVLWRVGGKRSAWMDLANTFDREALSLGADERLQIGLRLVQMMLDDEMPDHAVPILKTLLNDLDLAGASVVFGGVFWQLQARCFTELCAYDQALDAMEKAMVNAIDEETRERVKAERSEIQFLQGEGF